MALNVKLFRQKYLQGRDSPSPGITVAVATVDLEKKI